MTIHYMDLPLRDSDGDKIIVLGSVNQAKYGTDKLYYLGVAPAHLPEAGKHAYSTVGFEEQFPAPPPPPVVDNPNWHYSKDRLTGSIPGQIKAWNDPALGPRGTIWYEVGQVEDGRWAYSRDEADVPVPVVDEEEPTPPPPPPPPPPPVDEEEPSNTITAMVYSDILKGWEVVHQSDVLGVGLNTAGGICTSVSAPEGFRTDVNGRKYFLGMVHVGVRDEMIGQGRRVEGFGIVRGDKTYFNSVLAGPNMIPGGNVSVDTWEGEIVGVSKTQRLTVTGNRVRFDITLKNVSGSPIPDGDLWYYRAVDFDQDGNTPPEFAKGFNTTTQVTGPGKAAITLNKGVAKVLASISLPGSRIATTAFDKANTVGATLAEGQTRSNTDHVTQLVGPIGRLEIDEERSFFVEYEVQVPQA